MSNSTDPTLRQELDDIVYRCFAQGQYWGSDVDGILYGDEPEEPINHTQAVKLIEALITKQVEEARKDEMLRIIFDPDDWCENTESQTKQVAKDRISELTSKEEQK